MHLDGVLRQPEFMGDLFVEQAVGHAQQYPELLWRQLREPRGQLRILLGTLRRFQREAGVAIHHRPDRGADGLHGRRFRNEADGPELLRTAHHPRVVVRRNHQHRDLRPFGTQPDQRRKAAPALAASTHVAADTREDPQAESLLAGYRVWRIDDDALVTKATWTLIERWGCQVELAGGADEAIAVASTGNAPELILLDMRLGDTTGPQLYARLAKRWSAQPPVILVTAENDDALRASAHANGWGFLSKPVRPPALRALMMQIRLRTTRAV